MKDSQFDLWWEQLTRIDLVLKDEIKLRNSFRKVLSKMPRKDLNKFLSKSPVVFCSTAFGMVESFPVPPSPKNDGLGKLNLLVLRHDIVKRKDMTRIIAHECAHIVKGDPKHRSGPSPSDGGAHSKAMLDRLEKARKRTG
jgi:hypothetical protein